MFLLAYSVWYCQLSHNIIINTNKAIAIDKLRLLH